MLKHNLPTLRRQKKISQRELGRRIGMSGQYIAKLERGEIINPGIEALRKISEVLDVELHELTQEASTSFVTTLVHHFERDCSFDYLFTFDIYQDFYFKNFNIFLSNSEISNHFDQIRNVAKDLSDSLPVEIQLYLLECYYDLSEEGYLEFLSQLDFSAIELHPKVSRYLIMSMHSANLTNAHPLVLLSQLLESLNLTSPLDFSVLQQVLNDLEPFIKYVAYNNNIVSDE